MTKPFTLTSIMLTAVVALAGCNDETSCPAIAEAASTVEVVGTAAPKAQAANDGEAKAPAGAATNATTKVDVAKQKVAPDTRAPADDLEPNVDVDADLYVKRLVIARGVKDREPVEPASAFAKNKGKRIYAFVEVGNRDETASEVFVSFQPKGGKEGGRVPLRVGASPRWRTWAYTTQATDVGEWEAIVRNARGEVIGRQSFTVADLDESDPYENIDLEA